MSAYRPVIHPDLTEALRAVDEAVAGYGPVVLARCAVGFVAPGAAADPEALGADVADAHRLGHGQGDVAACLREGRRGGHDALASASICATTAAL